MLRCAALRCAQASPPDPDNFPFVVLGNKIDVDAGKARQVRAVRAGWALGHAEDARVWGAPLARALVEGHRPLWQCSARCCGSPASPGPALRPAVSHRTLAASTTEQVSDKKAKQWCGAKGNIPFFETRCARAAPRCAAWVVRRSEGVRGMKWSGLD